ncbi:MAG: TraR/DksA C4-type zinc finger protein [Myxococcota bacterium]|nr:TraR/DksA C4-type zinc finger protein [Myxococcota bacterium]
MDDLAPEEIDRLHAELVALNEELLLLVDISESDSRPVDLDQPIGRLSRMDAIAQQKISQANRQAAQARAKSVQSAIQRIAEGEYGDCLACGEPIGVHRLKVKPEAAFCIVCQSQREKASSVSASR